MEYKIGTDARCAVIGYGSWATAIVGLLAANGRRVGWYVRNPEVLESLCSDGRNLRYLNDLEFDRNSIAPSSDLDAVVRDADIVILATLSAYLKDFLAPLPFRSVTNSLFRPSRASSRATTRPSWSTSTTITGCRIGRSGW